MPELPEVETLRLQFSRLIIGKTIKSIEILNSKSFIGESQIVIGKTIKSVKRFAKILVIELSNGLYLAIHLKMSGQLILRQNRQLKYISRHTRVVINLPNKHTRVIIEFEGGNKLFFNDQRIFGWIKVVSDLSSITNKLGPDPLVELTAIKFYDIIHQSRKPVKVLLMDQEKIAGVGNIYANDALFLAGIHPKTPAYKLSKGQFTKLFDKLLQVLREGIKWRGASQNNFRDAYGRMGEKQEHFYVYDRIGDECLNHCGAKIQKIKLGGRGTFYCPNCQR